jgi:hypothetical protein
LLDHKKDKKVLNHLLNLQVLKDQFLFVVAIVKHLQS